jgi:protein tyrosine/serine phosphatase
MGLSRQSWANTWCVLLIGAAVIVGCVLASTHLNDNFHAIVVGEAYRAAQTTPDEIRTYRDQYHIATIINLRGKSTGSAWYNAEIEAAKNLGIQHIDFAMSAREELTPDRSLALIDLMKSVPKPVLIHCRAGSDRSGLAAALYLAAIAQAGEETSEGQLSLWFGHVAIPFVGTYAMDRTFELMEPLLGFHRS